MSPLLKLEQVSKIYQMDGIRVEALKSVSFRVSRGEFLVIMGPSGSGKSTLMHLIGLLDRPTSGQIFLNDNPVSKLSEKEQARLRNKEIGFIFQFFNLLERTSALDNVRLPLFYAGVNPREQERKARKALEQVGLGQRLTHYPSQLSGGERQRVAIARALVNNPSLILADEPTGNLDSKSGREIMKIIASLHREGRTVILITHDSSLTCYGQRLIVIKDGEIIEEKKL
ncbi:ABC transporter ATP-binding protein [Candidatus Shapirobacteria bacterium]|nr:ABC transporter ATP-binding protein [Candidatus Shapirobacteria bacterium]